MSSPGLEPRVPYLHVIRTLREKYREANKPPDMGLNINVPTTGHLSTRKHLGQIKLNVEDLKNVYHFKYLGSMIDKDGTISTRDVDLRVKAALSSWMELTVHKYIKENTDLRIKAALSSWMELTVHQHIKENMDLRVKAALSS